MTRARPRRAHCPPKRLPQFLSGLSGREQPTLLDLGSVVGGNLNFFGEQLGCKIYVEDLTKDIDRHVREDTVGALPGFFEQRFPQPDATFDGILCWDVFDYLEKPAVQALAAQVVRLLRPEGVVLAFFNHSETLASTGRPRTRGTSSSIRGRWNTAPIRRRAASRRRCRIAISSVCSRRWPSRISFCSRRISAR